MVKCAVKEYKNIMNIRLKYLVPSVFEVIAVAFAALAIVLLANSRQLLSYYDLQSSNQLIKSSAGGAMSQGLSRLDNFTWTGPVVTFLIWAGIGVICFSIAQGLVRAYKEFEFEEELSSTRYIHPSTFTKARFWKGVVKDFTGTTVGLLLVAAAVICFLLLVLPVGMAYSRVFLFDVSVSNFLYIILGLAVIFAGLVVIDVFVRILLQHRRLITRD